MHEFSLFAGDGVNRLLGTLGLGAYRPGFIVRRVLVAWSITWLPLAILAAISGVAVGSTLRETFLVDFAAYGQFWIGIPVLLAAEPHIDSRTRHAIDQLIRSGLLDERAVAGFLRSADGIAKASRRLLPDLILLGLAYLSTWLWLGEELSTPIASWHALLHGAHRVLTPAGWWVGLVSVPLWNFVLFRWVWKVVLWFWVLWRVSRSNLRLVPTHPDLAGGIGFLGDIQAVFGFGVFAVGSAVASTIGYKIVVEHARIETFAFAGPALSFIVIAPLTFVAPLLFFTSKLYLAREAGLIHYGLAACKHGRHFQSSWINPSAYADEQFVDNKDLQALGSIAIAFDLVHRMRIIPVQMRTLLRLFAAAAGPMLPLVGRFFPPVKAFLESLHL